MKPLGRMLREARKSKKMTLADVGKKLQRGVVRVHRFEVGVDIPTEAMCRALSKTLHMDIVDVLLRREISRAPHRIRGILWRGCVTLGYLKDER